MYKNIGQSKVSCNILEFYETQAQIFQTSIEERKTLIASWSICNPELLLERLLQNIKYTFRTHL